MGFQERVRYSGVSVEDNLRLRAVVRDAREKMKSDEADVWFILRQHMVAMELVRTPLFIPNPELDERGWDMQEKYTCDCWQVHYALGHVPEHLRRTLSEKLIVVFGEGCGALRKQVEENVWMRVFLPWTNLGYEQRRSDQLVFVKKCKQPMSDLHVLEQLAKDFKLRSPRPQPYPCRDMAEVVLLDLAYELGRRLLTLEDLRASSMDVSENLELVGELQKSEEEEDEDEGEFDLIGRERGEEREGVTLVNLLEDLEIVEEVREEPLTYVDVIEDGDLLEGRENPTLVGNREGKTSVEEVRDGFKNISISDSDYVLV